MRLIDADRLKQVIDLNFTPLYYDVMSQVINVQPTIEAVVQGEWEEDSFGKIRCSRCGNQRLYKRSMYDYENSNYCPYCGAKMDRRKDEDN